MITKTYEQDLKKIKSQIGDAARTFDEDSNLLENFCKHARQEFLRAIGFIVTFKM